MMPSPLSDPDLRTLFDDAPLVELARGEVLIEEGAPQRTVDLLESGAVTVTLGGVTVAMTGPGRLLGEVSFLERRSASATVVASQPTRVRRLDTLVLQERLDADPALAARVYRALAMDLSRKLRFSSGQVARTRAERARAGHDAHSGTLSPRQIPAALRARLRELRDAVQALDPLVAGGLDAAVAAQCEALVDLMRAHTRPDRVLEEAYNDPMSFRSAEEIRAATAAYIAREAFPWLMTSATLARGYARPRGVVEDDEVARMIDEEVPSGDGALGPAVDRWFLSLPWCQARRAGRAALSARLRAAPGAPLRVLSLGSGACGALFDAMEAQPGRLRALCIDLDPEAIRRASAEAHEMGWEADTTFIWSDARELPADPDVQVGPQDLISLDGLVEHLEDAELDALLGWAWERVAPGGCLYLSALPPDTPDRPVLEHILQWPLALREAEDLERRLGGLPGAEVEVRRLDEGGLIVVEARRVG